jgi:hypothetical protein
VDDLGSPLSRVSRRATISGIGRPGPIEERLGRRLIRLVEPESKEGLALLRSGRVTLVGPEGAPLACLGLDDARRMLRERLLRRLAGDDPERQEALHDGLRRLSSRRASRDPS